MEINKVIEEDNLIKITEENLREYADQLQFDTLTQECIAEDLCKSYNISKSDEIGRASCRERV